MNIQCKTCGSSDVVVACDRIMSPNDGCIFLCLKCKATFMDPVKTYSKEQEYSEQNISENVS